MLNSSFYIATYKLPEYSDRLAELKALGWVVQVTQTSDTLTRIDISLPVYDYC